MHAFPQGIGSFDLDVLKHLMKEHQAKYITLVDDEDIQQVHIRRSHVLADAFRYITKNNYHADKFLFFRESAGVHVGCFVFSLLNEISKSSFFAGHSSFS